MPIIDYEARALRTEKNILNDHLISEHNRKLLERFLLGYDVSAARKQIFLDRIKHFLIAFPRVESSINDRDRVNVFFGELRRRYSPASYQTFMGVIRRFLLWLNEGEPVPALIDVRKKRQGRSLRQLKPEDMLTWEEGLRIAQASCSVQLGAICLVQLDAGFRPSEFIDLKYGDVRVEKGLSVFHVSGGKTGSRNVVARRCVPALLKWLDAHPTKRAEDPLWIGEHSIRKSVDGQIKVKPYNYPALCKRLRETGKRAGIGKPLDMYCLRHSSCTLDRRENLPVDLAAERHGHSVKHFVGTYGRLSLDNVIERFNTHYGDQAESTIKPLRFQFCPTCKLQNTEDAEWCVSCGTPFTTHAAIQNVNAKATAQKELSELKKELQTAREREEAFRKEQFELLEEMRAIRKSAALEQFKLKETQ